MSPADDRGLGVAARAAPPADPGKSDS